MFTWKYLLVIFEVLSFASSYPIDPKDVPTSGNTIGIAAIGIAFLFTIVFITFACTCCKERRDGFKEFTNTGSLTNVGFTNALATEVSIFPPPGTATSGTRQSPVLVQVADSQQPSRPAAFSSTIPDISDWFVDPNANFPRQQLFYQKEIGKGWFGKVVEGEARGSKVIVRILREDATNEEKAYFLHEAKPYRDLSHKNVTRLFGRCLQYEPYLLLFELYNNGDLKSFLRANDASKKTINEQGISLKLMTDVCEGVKHMNDNGFIHTDLAARNCLVTSDLTVKIGDYGTSVDLYKNEYYIAGNVAVPIRWCAPESLHCTSTTIETKQVTAPANVWSLAVVLWEIAEFGKLPYFDLSDDQVIVRVHGEEKYRLSQPDCPYGHYLYNIMQLCWRNENRANVDNVLSMLLYLKTNPFQESDFETRWKKLKPNTVPIVDNHTPIHSPRHTELAQRPHLQTKSEFDSGVDLEIKPTDDNSCKTNSPMTISPQLSVTSEDIFQSTRKKSPSLTNLQGSLEDVSSQFDSWLQGVETKTDEDRTFARNVSEAIKNLDETLAMEKTSSSSSRDSSLECQNKPLLDFNTVASEISGQLERKSDSSSDTEEETWRHRIERGEFTEKVKEKSKSVTDLMVLTHIDSEESENDSLPSLTRQYSQKRNGTKGATYTSIGFGSEGNIRNAILSEELQEKLKSLTLWKTEDQSFLGKRTSDTTNIRKKDTEFFLVKPIPETSTKTKIQDVFLENSSVNKEQNFKKETATFLENEIKANSVFLEKNDKISFLETTKNDSVRGLNHIIVNKSINNVNNETSVNNNISSALVNNICIVENIKKQEIELESIEKTECEKLINTNDSSQKKDNVPKIIITESEIVKIDDEILNDDEIYIDFKPRKFKFVCKDVQEDFDEEEDEEEEDDETVLSVNEIVSNYIDEDGLLGGLNNPCEHTVILGSCEEYTLDYFKGLKTTFSPTEQYSDEESDVKESSSTKDSTVRQLTDTNDDCLSPSRDDSNTHITDDCISPLKDDGLKQFYDQLLEDETNECKENIQYDIVEEIPSKILQNELEDKCLNGRQNIEICDRFIKEELKLYMNFDDTKSENGIPQLGHDLKPESKGEVKVTDTPETSEKVISTINNNRVQHKNISNDNLKESQFKSAIINKVSKSKSLESILCNNKNELDSSKFLTNNSYIPVFSLSDMMSDDIFPKQNLNYDSSYYSVDSGHGSDRCTEQDRQMDDLKTRLEDVVKYGEDYQLHSSEDEYGGKLLTPDDERSSDSGFRDKGSLSESVEDTCDEKYNLEDIDAELEDFSTIKGVDNKEEVKYYEQFVGNDNEQLTHVQNVEGWFLHPKVEDNNEQQNGWLSLSTEDEEKHNLTIDDEFVKAIRNELKEKLPCAMQTQKTEEDNSPEQDFVDNLQFTYPAQLSPILEEQESNQSSLLVDDISPIYIIPPPEIPTESFIDDIEKTFNNALSSSEDIVIENSDGSKEVLLTANKFNIDDDVIIVDIETNEVTLIESPKPQQHLTFMKVGDNFMDDDSNGINSETYILSPDNVPLTPDISGGGSNTLSSPEHGNISGMCISPSSIRSDLFDSGPPSLPFDLGQSLEDVEELSLSKPTNEASEILQDLIDAGIVKKDNIKSEDVINNSEIIFIESSIQDNIETEKPYEACISKEIGDLLDLNSEQTIANVCSFLESERKYDMLVRAAIDTPDNPGTSKSSSPSKTIEVEVESSIDNTPSIVIDEEVATEQNETQLVNLFEEESGSKNDDLVSEIKAHCTSEQSKWLQELLLTSSVKKDKVDSIEDKLSVTQNWPSNDELLSPTSNSDGKSNGNLRPGNITSTLALMSPDLSSTDSRSHSLLSSFASTPSDDQKQFDSESTSRASAPSSLSISSSVINVPMPSPEDADKGWRPTICQLMELTDQAEGEEMTTSFIEPDENGIYTPDWESDTSDEQSSSSGEFVWKLQEPMKMERIDEEEENVAGESESDDNSSEGSGTEFVPSTWNALATPVKSAIRSPATPNKNEKKKVVFKKEKYQCVYEYPREPSDDEDSPDTWQTPSVAFDYSPFTDWELGDSEVGIANEGDSDNEDQRKPKKNQDYDFYRLDYNIGPHMITDDGEFFISSSSRILDWCGSGGLGIDDDGIDSEFFPGRDSLEFTPNACELTPLNLGELRHTKDSLRLELPLQIARIDQSNLTSDSGIDTSSPQSQSSTAVPAVVVAAPTQQQQQQPPTPPPPPPPPQPLTSTQKPLSCAQQSAREDKGEAAVLDEQPVLPTDK